MTSTLSPVSLRATDDPGQPPRTEALEDADVLGSEVAERGAAAGPGGLDWDAALRAYAATRTVRTAEVRRTARAWGELWHGDGLFRALRNELLRTRDPADYRHVDWLYGV